MNKHIKIIIVVLVIIVVISIIGFSSNDSSKNIKIGAILPLSGQYASIGEGNKNAILLAKENLGIEDIDFYFEDDKYDAKDAVSSYKKLKDLHDIDAVIVLGAPSIQAIKPLTDEDDIPLLGLGETLVHEVDSVFQLMPSGDTIMSVLGEIYSKENKKIVIAHSIATLFSQNADDFISGLDEDVTYEKFQIHESTDYRAEVSKIIQSNPDAVTVFMPKADALKFLKSLRVQDRNGDISIVCDWGTELAVKEYSDAIGKDRLEGCISTNIGDSTTDPFKESYKDKFNIDPEITADYTYDSVGIIKYLSETEFVENWISALSKEDFEYKGFASGLIKFNDDGTRLDNYPKISVYRSGEFVPLEN